MTLDQLDQLLDQHCAQLSEHFDAVHIFATKLVESGTATRHANRGSGNYFARYGQIRQWLVKEEETTREEAREEDE